MLLLVGIFYTCSKTAYRLLFAAPGLPLTTLETTEGWYSEAAYVFAYSPNTTYALAAFLQGSA